MEFGITTFDTAPTYEESERILGEVIPKTEPYIIATKYQSKDDVKTSLQRSAEVLNRPLSIVQVHNYTEMNSNIEYLFDYCVGETANEILVGATVYNLEEGIGALREGFDPIQVPFNLLDQRFLALFDEARERGVQLWLRSPLLQGMLTHRAMRSASHFSVVNKLRKKLQIDWLVLPLWALRFALSRGYPIVLGIHDEAELHQMELALRLGSLESNVEKIIQESASEDSEIIDLRVCVK